mmetsp:Transcript_36690/g.114565  ORF Transcript_36690/g.114565 Transcript_36690/m.114565 type:complete len:149 (-) Transcript_36690:1424-1870(-)
MSLSQACSTCDQLDEMTFKMRRNLNHKPHVHCRELYHEIPPVIEVCSPSLCPPMHICGSFVLKDVLLEIHSFLQQLSCSVPRLFMPHKPASHKHVVLARDGIHERGALDSPYHNSERYALQAWKADKSTTAARKVTVKEARCSMEDAS